MILDAISLAIAAAGLTTFAIAATFGRAWRRVLPVTLELWTAAGLLRLVGTPSWIRIATVAAIIAVRRLVVSTGRKN